MEQTAAHMCAGRGLSAVVATGCRLLRCGRRGYWVNGPMEEVGHTGIRNIQQQKLTVFGQADAFMHLNKKEKKFSNT